MTYETDALSLLMGFPEVGSVSVSCPGGAFGAILDRQYIALDDVETSAPALTARSSDVKRLGITLGALLTVEAEQYIVRSIQPDGYGMTVLRLEGP